ncbi:hypothetical protein ACH5RR_013849 [Cinchona calisaya]|uniref:Uncharacterized protein n=1 Tax=Cinchona calisaya TaxID=153742 RepID=A0ABD3A191_9GENT
MEEDERREVSIASAASLQRNFTPKSHITQSQLSKFQELHKRRLQMKAKSKTEKKIKGKSNEKESSGEGHDEKVSGAAGSSVSFPKQESVVAPNSVSNTKRQKKLHWGLDTKERWEMKANM